MADGPRSGSLALGGPWISIRGEAQPSRSHDEADGASTSMGGADGTGLIDDACAAVLARSIAAGALLRLKRLDLSGNRIGDAGLRALSDACAGGIASNPSCIALPELEELVLGSNKFSGEGLVSLAHAIDGGALPRLRVLRLEEPPPPENFRRTQACLRAVEFGPEARSSVRLLEQRDPPVRIFW